MDEKYAIEGAASKPDQHHEASSHSNNTSEIQDRLSSGQETASVKGEGFNDAHLEPQAGPDDATSPTPDGTEQTHQEWIEGFQLFVVMAGITLVIFLMLLDTSIVATVCLAVIVRGIRLRLTVAGCSQNHKPVPLAARCCVVWQCIYTR